VPGYFAVYHPWRVSTVDGHVSGVSLRTTDDEYV
jgi:hypothetical protein